MIGPTGIANARHGEPARRANAGPNRRLNDTRRMSREQGRQSAPWPTGAVHARIECLLAVWAGDPEKRRKRRKGTFYFSGERKSRRKGTFYFSDILKERKERGHSTFRPLVVLPRSAARAQAGLKAQALPKRKGKERKVRGHSTFQPACRLSAVGRAGAGWPPGPSASRSPSPSAVNPAARRGSRSDAPPPTPHRSAAHLRARPRSGHAQPGLGA